MAKKSAAYLRSRFESGDKPTQADFIDLIDSLLEVPFFDLDPNTTGPGITVTYRDVVDQAALPVPTVEGEWAKLVNGEFYRATDVLSWEFKGTRNFELPPYLAGSNGEGRIRIRPELYLDPVVWPPTEIFATVTVWDEWGTLETAPMGAWVYYSTDNAYLQKIETGWRYLTTPEERTTSTDCFIRLPHDYTDPAELAVIRSIGLDAQIYIDTSLNNADNYVLGEFTRSSGDRFFPSVGITTYAFKFGAKEHVAFECYIEEFNDIITYCRWTPVGFTAVLFHSCDGDGWGNGIDVGPSGLAKRYTLGEDQYNYFEQLRSTYPLLQFVPPGGLGGAIALAADEELVLSQGVIVGKAKWLDITDPSFWGVTPNLPEVWNYTSLNWDGTKYTATPVSSWGMWLATLTALGPQVGTAYKLRITTNDGLNYPANLFTPIYNCWSISQLPGNYYQSVGMYDLASGTPFTISMEIAAWGDFQILKIELLVL